METRYIDTFLMVAECGSMAEAARRMSITPTALAQRLRALERDFGVPLVIRSGRFVRITEGGARLLSHARRFQRDMRNLKSAVASDGFPGGLRIGTIRTALTNVMPELLKHVSDRYPQLDATLEIGASHDLYHQVLGGKVDAALLVAPPFKLPKSYVWETVRVEPLVVLAPAHLAHAALKSLLAEQPFMRYDRRTWGGALAEQYLQEHGIQPHERYEMDSPDGILMLVGMGLGVSLVPNCYRPASVPENVRLLPLPSNALTRKLGLLYPRESPYARLFEAVIEDMRVP